MLGSIKNYAKVSLDFHQGCCHARLKEVVSFLYVGITTSMYCMYEEISVNKILWHVSGRHSHKCIKAIMSFYVPFSPYECEKKLQKHPI